MNPDQTSSPDQSLDSGYTIKTVSQAGAESGQAEAGGAAALAGAHQSPAALGELASDFVDDVIGKAALDRDGLLGVGVDGGDQGIGQTLHLRGTVGGGLLGGGVGVAVGLVLLGGDVAHDDLSNRLVKN